MAQSIRCVTYGFGAGDFAGLTCDVVLLHDLSPHYFVLINGVDNTASSTPGGSGVRVTRDPFGTGDLVASGATDEIRLEREDATNDWLGTITVVESLGDHTSSGFRLLDVIEVAIPALPDEGVQTVTVTCRTTWGDSDKVAVYGGARAGGVSTASVALTTWPTLGVAVYHHGSDSVACVRSGESLAVAAAATATVYAVEWGSEYAVQLVPLGTAGGEPYLEDTSSWTPSPTRAPIATAESWLHSSATAPDDALAYSWLSSPAVLGDGVNIGAVESTASLGRTTYARNAVAYAYVVSHTDLLVEYAAYAAEAGLVSTLVCSAPLLAEARGVTGGGLDYTDGARFGAIGAIVRYYAAGRWAEATWGLRHTADAALTATRLLATDAWDGWITSVDFGGIVYSDETVTGTDHSATSYAGLVLPDRRLAVWAAESSYTEADPRPGVPEASQATGMVLRTSGVQVAATHLHVMSIRSGYPGSQGAADGASYVWREDTDAATEWRGWDPPHVQTAWECLEWTDGVAAGIVKWVKDPHLVTLADGSVLLAYSIYDDGEATYKWQVQVRRKPAGSQTWGAAVGVVTWSAAPVLDHRPCLLVLPSGRILLYHLIDRSGRTQVRMWYSDDDGATWTLGQDYCLNYEYVTTTIEWGRFRVATLDGQVLLVAHVYNGALGVVRDQLRQLASSDMGATFDNVSAVDDATYYYGFPDVAVSGGCFVVTYVWYESAGTTAGTRAIRLGSAFESMASISDAGDYEAVWAQGAVTELWGVLLGGPRLNQGIGCQALTVDETDTLYCYGQNPTWGRGYLVRSLDSGITWEDMGTGSAPDTLATGMWWYAATATTYPYDFAVTSAEGRIVMAHIWASATSTEADKSLGIAYFGGYSSVTMPGYEGFPNELTRVGWESVWYPCDLPDALNWAVATAGASVAALASPGLLSIETFGPGDTHFYSLVPASASVAEPIILRVDMQVATGTPNLGASDVSVYVALDDGIAGFVIEVRFTRTAGHLHYKVRDAVAGAFVGGEYDVGAEAGSLIIALGDGRCAVWHRARDLDADRLWEVGPSSTTLGDNGGALGAPLIQWGHRAANISKTYWYEVHEVDATFSGFGLDGGLTNPDQLLARGYSFAGTYLDGGTILQAVDGPTIRSDEWEIETRYGYELARVFRASPRIAWRSTTTGEQSLAFRVSDFGDADLGNDLIGIGLYGTNVPEIKIYLYDLDTTTWVYFGEAQAYQRLQGLGYDRHGNTVRPSAVGSTYNPSMGVDEFAGGYFWFDTSDSRRISENCEGVWNSGGTKEAVLYLEDVDGTEATSGTDGRICPRNWLVLVHLFGQRYTGIKLVITAAGAGCPAPPESYWEIGSLVIGPVAVFGQHHAWGRVIEPTAGAEVFEARDRTSQSYVAAPVQRVVEFGWQDGCLLAQDPLGEADPGFVYANANPASLPVALTNDVSPQTHGIIRRLDGPHRPCIYVPRFAFDDDKTALQVLPRRWQSVFMRLTESIRIEAVQGAPNVDEVVRVPIVSGREVV